MLSNFADTAQEMYAQMSASAAVGCAVSAVGCAGGLVTPGGQVLAAGACPTTMPLCELALASGVASMGADSFGTMMNEATENKLRADNWHALETQLYLQIDGLVKSRIF